MTTFTPISGTELNSFWAFIEPRMLSALDKSFGEYSIEWIKDSIVTGEITVIIVCHHHIDCGLLAYMIEGYPNGLALNVFAVAGKGLKQWVVQALDYLEGVARQNDCKWMKAHGGPRWRELGKKHGFREHSVFAKTLCPGT